MPKLICVSGPCGCGKSTFARAYARDLVNRFHRAVYLIHGDDFQRGFIEPEDKGAFFADGIAADPLHWEEILRFNWDCILDTAGRALERGRDVVLDYVIEDELPRVREPAERHRAELYAIVLTADAEEIERRIRARGDVDMIERALFLKRKLDALPENQGHFYDNTRKSPEDSVREIVLDDYLVR